ncbi:MAG: M20 family metallopeptidase [Paracoccaceae bacterium]|nr:M20 family metallopeptidase [Paracoccaceae bacterium]
MRIKNKFGELFESIKGWRHHLHETPELLYDTIKTSAFVEKKLKEFGCDKVITGLGRTGVVGIIHGKKISSGKVIGLRADMDALPLQEKTNLDYASKVPGVMHACGHDGHTAMLLGAANYLAETRNFNGKVAVIFQPAEEGGGGAKEMIDDGLMDQFEIQEVYGMHNMPGLELGSFAIKEGDFFAAADTFCIKVKGKGGHAAKPQETIDPVLVGSNVVMALQSISSRNIDPIKNVVVSVCTFKSDTDSFNVIPETITLKGTVRTFEKGVQKTTKNNLIRLSKLIAESYGGSVEVKYTEGYPVMKNSAEETNLAAKVAEAVSGRTVVDAHKIMGAEDFSFMLNSRKGAYILIGNGNSAGVHNPTYVFNDEALPLGASFWAELAETRMQGN